MQQLLVVKGNGTDIVIRGKGSNQFTEILTETPGGSLLFVLDTVARTYEFGCETTFANKHLILSQLRIGQYTPRSNVQFICEALSELVLKVQWAQQGNVPVLWLSNYQYRLFRLLSSDPLVVDTSPYLSRFNVCSIADSTLSTLATVVKGVTFS